MRKTKDFDCVEMMHQGQDQAKLRLEGLSKEETLAYHKQRAEALREEQLSLQTEASSTADRV